MEKYRILHITPWFPTEESPANGIFVRRHIQSISPSCSNITLHITYKTGTGSKLLKRGENQYECIVGIPKDQWILKELFSYKAIIRCFSKLNSKNAIDSVHFHIAYPHLRFTKKLKKKLKVPLLIIEHWTAYHFNFHIEKEKKLKKIKQIFHHDIPVATVSHALRKDIEEFSGVEIKKHYLLNNIVDTEVFNHPVSNDKVKFFMMASWGNHKNPFPILEALTELKKEIDFELVIGGLGAEIEKIKSFVFQSNLKEVTNFTGWLTPSEASEQFKNSSFFLHCTTYETASVVCMESLCCGTPVIASSLPAIAEYLTDDYGILVEDNTAKGWLNAVKKGLSHQYSPDEMSLEFTERFSMNTIGKKYFEITENVIANYGNE